MTKTVQNFDLTEVQDALNEAGTQASAEAKRKSQQLEETWSALLKRQGIEAETRKKTRAMTTVSG